MSKVYEICKEIMKAIIEAGCVKEVSRREVRTVIILKRGGDPRTIRNWIKNLLTLGFLNRRAGGSVFCINYERYPELLTLTLKGDSQKKLM